MAQARIITRYDDSSESEIECYPDALDQCVAEVLRMYREIHETST